MLLSHTAPLEVKNQYGRNVLGQTVWSALHEPKPEHLPIIDALLAADASLDAVHYPTENAPIGTLLSRHGAK